MTFDEWWGVHRSGYFDVEVNQNIEVAAHDAWAASRAATREELLTKFNRTGVDIDAALHGRVNDQSPIANRLRIIAATQPQWRPIATAPLVGKILVYTKGGRLSVAYWCADEWNKKPKPYWQMQCHFNISQSRLDQPICWMPLPPPPEKTATGEKEQEARDVTR